MTHTRDQHLVSPKSRTRFTVSALTLGAASIALVPALADPLGHSFAKEMRKETTAPDLVARAHTEPGFGSDPVPTPLERDFYGLPNLAVANVLEADTFRFIGGQLQANPSGASGTGNQTYFLSAEYGLGRGVQLGFEYSKFADPISIAGTRSDTNNRNYGLKLSYNFLDNGPLKATAIASAELHWSLSQYFGTRTGPDDQNAIYSFRLPVSYQVSDAFQVHLTPGVSVLPETLNGIPYHGVIGQLGVGATWRASERFQFYGSLNAPFGPGGNTIDGATGAIKNVPVYTVGGRFMVSPQAGLDLYVTNGFGATAATEILTFAPDGDTPVIGARLVYSPAWGTRQPTSYRAPDGAKDLNARERRLHQRGFTFASAHTVDPGLVNVSGGYSNGQHFNAAVRFSPDRDLELGYKIERLADNGTRSSGRSLGTSDEFRWSVHGKLRLLDQQNGNPFTMALNVEAGREFSTRFGVGFASVPLSYEISPNLTLMAEPKLAAYGSDTLYGIGFGANYELFEGLDVIAEVNATSDNDVTWAVGARYGLESVTSMPASVEISATNAIGNHGAATLIGQDEVRYSLGLNFAVNARPILDGLF